MIKRSAAALLLFASGAAALIFQVLWIKQLSLVVGVDVYAVTIGVSAFFAGLALGSFYFGPRADRTDDPYLLYSSLEFAVAIFGVAGTLALARSARLFVTLEETAGLAAWILPFVVVGLPALFMGGTLPTMVRAAFQSSIDTAGARLYAANTAGAITGSVLAAFLLIPSLGVQGTSFAAAAISVTAAVTARFQSRQNRTSRAAIPGDDAPLGARLALALYAIAGGIALGYEVVWSQAIVSFMSTRSFAFAVVLATYLLGLALGSAVYSRFSGTIRDPWGTFAILISAAGLLGLLEIAALGHWLIVLQTQAEVLVLHATGSALAGMCARFAVAAASVVFLPTLLLGAAFPAAVRLTSGWKTAGRDLGAVMALNTVGGIAGTMLTGFLLVPLLGLVRTLGVLAVAAAAVGAIAVMQPSCGRKFRLATLSIGATAILAAVLTPIDRLANLLPGAREGRLTFYEESAGGTVAVVEQKSGRFRRLYIQGVSNSGDAMPSLRYMRLQALVPLLIHSGEPKSALVIGFGTGITAGALIPYPGLERRVVAELLPAVVKAAPQFQGNYSAESNSSVEIRLRDGRRELLRSPERYDLITLEPPPPSAAGVVNLYSRDFYALAATRLNPAGIVAQWLPLPTQNDEDTRSLVRSFIDAFPHASLWTTELHEMLLVGSYAPMEIDAPRLAARFNQPGVAAALKEVGITSPAALIATWITDRDGLQSYAGTAPPVTDDFPRIEYAGWVRENEITRVLPRLLRLTTEPPLRGATADLRTALGAERAKLFEFYAASLAAYEKDHARSVHLLQEVLAQDPNNPYFRWFLAR